MTVSSWITFVISLVKLSFNLRLVDDLSTLHLHLFYHLYHLQYLKIVFNIKGTWCESSVDPYVYNLHLFIIFSFFFIILIFNVLLVKLADSLLEHILTEIAKSTRFELCWIYLQELWCCERVKISWYENYPFHRIWEV